MKVYLIYKIEDGTLYAHTISKKFYKSFRNIHSDDKFSYTKTYMDNDEYEKFCKKSEYSDKSLCKVKLKDISYGKDIPMIMTDEEIEDMDTAFFDEINQLMLDSTTNCPNPMVLHPNYHKALDVFDISYYMMMNACTIEDEISIIEENRTYNVNVFHGDVHEAKHKSICLYIHTFKDLLKEGLDEGL